MRSERCGLGGNGRWLWQGIEGLEERFDLCIIHNCGGLETMP